MIPPPPAASYSRYVICSLLDPTAQDDPSASLAGWVAWAASAGLIDLPSNAAFVGRLEGCSIQSFSGTLNLNRLLDVTRAAVVKELFCCRSMARDLREAAAGRELGMSIKAVDDLFGIVQFLSPPAPSLDQPGELVDWIVSSCDCVDANKLGSSLNKHLVSGLEGERSRGSI
jgi:hypothetical protein